MNEKIIEQTTVINDYPTGTVQTSKVVSRTPFADFFVSKVNQVIFSIVGILNLVILIRLFLLLVGANQVGFTTFIMNITNVFVAPFQGIFPSPSNGVQYLEAASLAAIVVYTIIALIIATVIGLFSNDVE